MNLKKGSIFFNLIDYICKPSLSEFFVRVIATAGLKKFIITTSSAGLANRLKGIISSMRLADRLSRMLIIYWPENNLCNCKFSDLFENKMICLDENGYRRLMNRIGSSQKYALVSTWRLLTLPSELTKNFAKVFPSQKGNDIDFEFERIPIFIREVFLSYINRFSPVKYIKDEVEGFSTMFEENMVSVSIRSWPEDIDRATHLFKIENFYTTMDKLAEAKFFVSCDSQEVLEKIIDRYGKRVLYYPKRTFPNDRNSKYAIQDAMIDLLLLSKNKIFKAAYCSTFSEMAWWFGGCNSQVEAIKGNKDVKDFLTQDKLSEGSLLIPRDILNIADRISQK